MHQLKVASLALTIFAVTDTAFSQEQVFPGRDWTTAQPEMLNINDSKVKKLFDLSFEDSSTQAVVLIKNGHLIGERYADSFDHNSFGTSWSMAKSFYAALIGISIDRNEIHSLDDPVHMYLEYFNDERSKITVRDLLNMTSGLEFPENEHESMFFRHDQIEYAKSIRVEKEPTELFEYNNVNSMLLGEILENATGQKADTLLKERIFSKIGIDNYTLWRDGAGNPMTYCCIDMSARDYSKFGLLFSRKGRWNDQRIISEQFVNEILSPYWNTTPSWWTKENRGYSLHWWISKNDDESMIYNASGKFGQYIFIDHKNDVIFTRITKYYPMPGSTQNWSFLKYIEVDNVDLWIRVLRVLLKIGIIDASDITSPTTFEDGESNEFYSNYGIIIDAIADLSRD